jgi:hypothetical protein
VEQNLNYLQSTIANGNFICVATSTQIFGVILVGFFLKFEFPTINCYLVNGLKFVSLLDLQFFACKFMKEP